MNSRLRYLLVVEMALAASCVITPQGQVVPMQGCGQIAAAPAPAPAPAPQAAPVAFDHPWQGTAEQKLRSLLASGLAGPNGSNGQAVVDQMNSLGGVYSGGEFQPHHDGVGAPTYGFPWFYVSFVPLGNGQTGYQIVEFGTPPASDK